MAIKTWSPVHDLVALQDRMNRLFEESLNVTEGEEELSNRAWAPVVDIYEVENELVIKAEVPEVSRKDIDIRVENNVLTIFGERKFDEDIKKDNYHRIERRYGSFSRSFTLPSRIDAEKVHASYREGVLTIRLPKLSTSQPRQIKIG